MKTILSFTLFLVILSPVRIQAQYQCSGQQNSANCPPCYYNQSARTPTKGGTRGGRHVVKVHTRGNIPTNGYISGVTEGMRRWNDATDTTSQPGTVNRPPYIFEPAGLVENADVVIEFTTDNSKTTSATYNPNTTPPTIYINTNHPNWNGGANLDQIAGAVAHELGHDRGLANAYPANSGCNFADTVMRGASHTTPHDRDVFQMNRALNSPGGCCADANNPQNTDTGGDGGGGDPCGGDPCCGDYCCSDPSSCGGYSYCITYTGQDCYEECWVINAYTNQCEYWHQTCVPYSWTECY